MNVRGMAKLDLYTNDDNKHGDNAGNGDDFNADDD